EDVHPDAIYPRLEQPRANDTVRAEALDLGPGQRADYLRRCLVTQHQEIALVDHEPVPLGPAGEREIGGGSQEEGQAVEPFVLHQTKHRGRGRFMQHDCECSGEVAMRRERQTVPPALVPTGLRTVATGYRISRGRPISPRW